MILNNLKQELEKAKKLHQSGNLNEAIKIYLKLIKAGDKNPEVNFYLGTAYLQSKDYENSIIYLEKCLKYQTSNPMVFNNLGIAFKEIGDLEEARNYFNSAIKLKKNFAQAYNNQGIVLRNLNNYKESLKFLKKAIELNPNYPEAFNNIGNTLNDLGDRKKAIDNYKKAIELNPNYIDAYLNIGTEYMELGYYDAAKKSFLKIREIENNFNFLDGKLLNLSMKTCDWENFDEEVALMEKYSDSILMKPFFALSVTDKQLVHKKITENYVNKSYNIKINNNTKNRNKIPKIGYFSPDLSDHAFLYLMFDTFKNHNKEKFDIYGFSFGQKARTKKHHAVKKFFKDFIYIDEMSDKKVSELCKDIGIDIAVDVCGHTSENRLGIFAERAARIQINYLGYPGTLGAGFIDYIIADEYIIPKEDQGKYTEKVLYMPFCYQSNPNKVVISKKKFEKKDFKIPENKFIFCSFNNHNKITPFIFKLWMRILNRVEDCILWLFVQNETAKKNILKEAKKNNVNLEKIIFALPLERSIHLKRLKIADLFLDTYPYNAHTTGSDAFRVGLPAITLKGKTFASRVLGSILYSNGLNELIVDNAEEYEELAVELASNKKMYNKLKERVKEKSKNSRLFDNFQFTRDLENIYINLIDNEKLY